MKSSHVDHLTCSLNRGGPRRWALKRLAVGVVGLGMLTRGTRTSEAQTDELFQQCLRACLASCGTARACPTFESCAASCSQAMW